MSDDPRHPWPLPRDLRFRDAPHYLGMDRNRFNAEVRPYVTEVPIGKQGIGFDRLELDAWFEDYKSRNGRPARKGERHGTQTSARPHHAGRDLAHRQTHPRAESLPKHWQVRLEEAEKHLARVMEQTRQAQIYGMRPTRTFEQAAAKFVLENQHKRSLSSDIVQLQLLMPSLRCVPISTGCTSACFSLGCDRRRKEGKAVLVLSTTVSRSSGASSIWPLRNGWMNMD